jgi:hypothetical protein
VRHECLCSVLEEGGGGGDFDFEKDRDPLRFEVRFEQQRHQLQPMVGKLQAIRVVGQLADTTISAGTAL